ncbi:hypothetical protein JL09_g6215 [Pichia kudriavzevii]|uniref:Uncharacterized protein n=1 Tax=Pichia kudriavzevii TaxID=4909 RepID=A0A099NRR3_PICKU|nr:hypothetical protein JL09_g6215 [Pichia kudriavzevii]
MTVSDVNKVSPSLFNCTQTGFKTRETDKSIFAKALLYGLPHHVTYIRISKKITKE